MKFKCHICSLKMLLLLSALSTLIMTGCMPKPNPILSATMIPENIELQNKHPYSLSIDVFGGLKPDCINFCITTESFLDAVTSSISNTGLFSTITNKEDADYLLDIVIMRNWVAKESTLITQWELTNTDSKNLIWSEVISTKQSSSLWGNKRFKDANELTAKENIEEGIKKMSSLTEL